MSQNLLINFKYPYVGWALTVHGYTLLDNAGAHYPVRERGNELPPTREIIQQHYQSLS